MKVSSLKTWTCTCTCTDNSTPVKKASKRLSWEPPAPRPTQWLTSGKIGGISRLFGIKTSFPLVTHAWTLTHTVTHNTPFLGRLLCVYLYLTQQSGSCFPVLLYFNNTLKQFSDLPKPLSCYLTVYYATAF